MKKSRKKEQKCHILTVPHAPKTLLKNWKDSGRLSQKDFEVAVDEMLLNLMSEELKNWFKEEGGYEYDQVSLGR